jgi:hypothetical protein
MDLAGQLADAGCDTFYFTGFSLDQQQKAKGILKKPLMVGSSGPATGVGAMYTTSPTGPFSNRTGLPAPGSMA